MLSTAAAWARMRVPRSLRQLAVLVLGRALGHRRDERTHHLRVPAERSEAERGGDLPDREVDERTRDVVAARIPATTARARSFSPARSSRPITGSTSQTMATYRLLMNALPNAATTSSGPSPPPPVASPATVTTSSGFIRRTKPTTTMRMPTRVSMGDRKEDLQNHRRGLSPCPKLRNRMWILQGAEPSRLAPRSASDPVIHLHLKHIRRPVAKERASLRTEIEIAIRIASGAALRPYEEHR